MIGHSLLVFHNFNSMKVFEGKALSNIWDYFIMVDSQGCNYLFRGHQVSYNSSFIFDKLMSRKVTPINSATSNN